MLPDLPKQNKKQEADFGVRFRRWWERAGMYAPYELKDSRGENSIAFSELSEDQERIGRLAKSDKGVLIRIINGTPGSPDYVGFKNSPYWVVIKYPKCAEIIDLDTLLLERSRSKRKSLTAARAHEISTITINV